MKSNKKIYYSTKKFFVDTNCYRDIRYISAYVGNDMNCIRESSFCIKGDNSNETELYIYVSGNQKEYEKDCKKISKIIDEFKHIYLNLQEARNHYIKEEEKSKNNNKKRNIFSFHKSKEITFYKNKFYISNDYRHPELISVYLGINITDIIDHCTVTIINDSVTTLEFSFYDDETYNNSLTNLDLLINELNCYLSHTQDMRLDYIKEENLKKNSRK